MVRIPEEERDDSRTHQFVSVGQVLSRRFEVVREIARGGMGVVFEAADRMLDGHRVALKLLPAEVAANRAARTRLKREALAAIELTHPNITRLHSYEEDGDHAFLVMELLEGETLEEALVDRGPLPIDELLEVARAAAQALITAHARGVIHRDIKPANLMYSSPGEGRVLKVADFGIAFRLRETLSRLTGLEAAGTLHYCAPEQLRNLPADARSDQYSLAATLYELASGEPPFPGPGIEHKILEVAPRPLEVLPPHFDRGLRTALAKQPEARFPDIAAFLAALEGEREVPEPATQGSTLGARADLPASGGQEQGRWGGRLPWAVAGLSLALAGLFGSGTLPAQAPPTPVSSPLPPSPTPITAIPTPAPPRPLLTWPRVQAPPADPGPGFRNQVGVELRWVSPGRFRMGSEVGETPFENQTPAREVEIRSGFWLGRHEVTQQQFERVLGYNPSVFTGADRPVDSVIWNDARHFCRLLTEREREANALPEGFEYRLPTEAQWEYACRAGERSSLSTGALDAQAWYLGNAEDQSQFVGKKAANAWGFHDMVGNVWEYALDRWHDSLDGAPTDERPWNQGVTHLRTIRGGSWGYDAASNEAASRGRPHAGFRLDNVGFRVALVPDRIPTVPQEVTVRLRSTPPGARVIRPGFPGTLGRVGTLDEPVRISLPLGRHQFEFKVFNRRRRVLEYLVEETGDELGLWAILDPAPEAEDARVERARAEARLAQADAALAEARAAATEATLSLERAQLAARTVGAEPGEETRARASLEAAKLLRQRRGLQRTVAEQNLRNAVRGDEGRVPVVIRSTPGARVTNLDPWGEEDPLGYSWDDIRLELRPATYTFRFVRRPQEGEPVYLPHTVEVEVRGGEEILVEPALEVTPEAPEGAEPGELRHDLLGLPLVWLPDEGDAGLWFSARPLSESERRRALGQEVDIQAPFRAPVRDLAATDAAALCGALTVQARARGRLDSGWAYRPPSVAEAARAQAASRAGFPLPALDLEALHLVVAPAP